MRMCAHHSMYTVHIQHVYEYVNVVYVYLCAYAYALNVFAYVSCILLIRFGCEFP